MSFMCHINNVSNEYTHYEFINELEINQRVNSFSWVISNKNEQTASRLEHNHVIIMLIFLKYYHKKWLIFTARDYK